MKIAIPVIIFIVISATIFPVFAGPQSTTYELKEFGFGAGGVASASSNTYSLFGTAGEIDVASSESNTYRANAGLVFTLQVATPPTPSFTNPGNNYDRLKIVIATGNNPTDTRYAIAITDDNWATTKYIQSDYTVAGVLGAEDWLTYSGAINVGWGDTGGFYVTGLKNNTVYRIKVKAKQGNFTESPWGPEYSQTTSDPSLTFGIGSASITFSNLNSGNSFTDSSKTTVLTTSTNAYNGYIVYAYESQPLTHTIDGTKTIADYGGTNAIPTSWTGNGFGYTTNDNNLVGSPVDRFTNGGPKYAKFITDTPGEPVADHAGPILSPITGEQFTISYRVTAPSTTMAGTYTSTIQYIVVPTY